MALFNDIKEEIYLRIISEHYSKYTGSNYTHSFLSTTQEKPRSLILLEINNFYCNMVCNLNHITKCNIVQAGGRLEYNIDDLFNEYYYKYKDYIIDTHINGMYVKQHNTYRLRNIAPTDPKIIVRSLEIELCDKHNTTLDSPFRTVTELIKLCLDKATMCEALQNG